MFLSKILAVHCYHVIAYLGKEIINCVIMINYLRVKIRLSQAMQSRDSCVQREISSSITLLQLVSSDFVRFLRIFFRKYITACSEITF